MSPKGLFLAGLVVMGAIYTPKVYFNIAGANQEKASREATADLAKLFPAEQFEVVANAKRHDSDFDGHVAVDANVFKRGENGKRGALVETIAMECPVNRVLDGWEDSGCKILSRHKLTGSVAR